MSFNRSPPSGAFKVNPNPNGKFLNGLRQLLYKQKKKAAAHRTKKRTKLNLHLSTFFMSTAVQIKPDKQPWVWSASSIF